MATQYKLVYFKIGGRAEPIRLMFHYAGQPFEDERIDKTDWVAGKAYKNGCKYGQVPILEISTDEGGQVRHIAESATIVRFLAEKFGLMGKDEWEKVQADEFAELCNDFHLKIQAYKAAWKTGDTGKLREEVLQPAVAQYYGYLEKFLEAVGSDFLLPSGPSYADFVWAFTGATLIAIEPNALQAHPLSAQHARRIYALPQLQKYLQTLPEDYLTQKL